MLKLGFLASYNGSNMVAILEAIQNGDLSAQPCVVISNNPTANALKVAAELGIPNYCFNVHRQGSEQAVDAIICETLLQHDVEWVILNGYMKKIGNQVLANYENHILNVHPSLLPKFGGQGMYGHFVHEAVIAAGEVVSGATIHLVNPVYDEGKILRQQEVPVLTSDSADTLAARVQAAERQLYVSVLQAIYRRDLP